VQDVALKFDTGHCVFPVRLRVATFAGRSRMAAGAAKRVGRVRRPRPVREKKKTILIAASDPARLQWKTLVLERAGYVVIAATTIEQIKRTCRKYKIDLVLLGSSLSPAEKRKFWQEARSNCRSPVLELYGTGAPELMDESRYVHTLPHTPSDFVEAVRTILDQQ
jgi:DNA-binding NtrC family response regulator